MKAKLTKAMAAVCLVLVLPLMGFGQYTIIDDQFYSNALGADNMVDVWLPPGYYDNPRPYYPVIYLLHSAVDHTGNLNNQNGYENFLPILNQMTADGEIDPFIVVKPNGWAPPYAGSCWYNSPLYGNFEDMVRTDLINYIEANYRVLKGQDYRYIMGHSMGGHAGWSMSIRFPELFGAVADIAGYKNMAMAVQLMTPIFLAESGGAPPYNYSPANGQLSALVFTLLGAYNANMANPPFYVNVFLDANGNIIPTYYNDFLADDIYQMIPVSTQPANTEYWIGQSPTDPVVPWPSITQFTDLLNEYNWDYDFFPYEGGHFLIDPAMEEAFRFIDGVWKTKSPPLDYSLMIEDIEFQPGVTIDINVNVFVNENATNWANHGKIFAVEGMAHTANCWKPFAEELFLNGPQSAQLNEFYAIDMPGKGGSGLPEGLNSAGNAFLLDQMYLDDYLAVISGALNYLIDEHGVRPNTIMGHSMGGMEVILLQDKLIKRGSNMKKTFGIKNAILLAPAIPAPLDWAYINGGGSAALFNYVQYFTPEYGTILNIPYEVWPWVFFTNTCCYFPPGNPFGYPPSMVPGAPTPLEVLTNGYKGIEPAPILLQLSGTPIPPGLPYPYKPRPAAEPGIFKPQHGVQLTIFSDEFDKMMTPEEEWTLYKYLTDDKHGKCYLPVLGEETCHDTHISDPGALVELLDKPYFFKNADAIAEEIVPARTEITIHPNPFKDNLHIGFSLTEKAAVSLSIYNSVGALVAEADYGIMQPGNTDKILHLTGLHEGIYFIKVRISDRLFTRKAVRIK